MVRVTNSSSSVNDRSWRMTAVLASWGASLPASLPADLYSSVAGLLEAEEFQASSPAAACCSRSPTATCPWASISPSPSHHAPLHIATQLCHQLRGLSATQPSTVARQHGSTPLPPTPPLPPPRAQAEISSCSLCGQRYENLNGRAIDNIHLERSFCA